MPRQVLPLTHTKVDNAKPRKTPYKLFDGGGLYLLVPPSGGRLWRFKYRFGNRERLLSFGAYPEVSLGLARQRREEARRLIAAGQDPGDVRKAAGQAEAAQAETFEAIGREWFERFAPTWADTYSSKVLSRIERDVFPWIGKRPIAEIKAVLALCDLLSCTVGAEDRRLSNRLAIRDGSWRANLRAAGADTITVAAR
jgi:hypothetical protein